MHLSSRLLVLLVPAILLLGGREGNAEPPRPASPAEDVLERFEIGKDWPAIFLPVELKGATYLFVLDTGSTRTVYDASLVSKLGEPIRRARFEVPGGNTSAQLFKSPDAKLGKLSLRTETPVAALDLRGIRTVSGEEVYGIIGMDFLAQHVFRVDPDLGEVVFLKGTGPGSGQRISVKVLDRHPHVEVGVAGLDAPEWFLVDTGDMGFGSGDMRREVYDALVRKDKVKGAGESLFESLAGTTVDRRFRADVISLAGNRHEQLLFSEGSRSILGVNYWSRYKVTFDFPDSAIYLAKGRRFNEPDVQDMSGLKIIRPEGRTVVYSVENRGPAATAGILAKDEILKVDEKDVKEIRLAPLRRLLSAEGQKVRLVLKRDDETHEVSLVLRDWRHERAATTEGK